MNKKLKGLISQVLADYNKNPNTETFLAVQNLYLHIKMEERMERLRATV